MIYFSVTGAINALTAAMLGWFVYTRDRASIIHRTYALFNLAVFFWSFGYIFWPLTKTKADTLYWFRILHIGAIFIPVSFLHFATAFLEINRKKVVAFGYLLSLFFASFVFSPLYIKDMRPVSIFPWWGVPGILYYFFLMMFLVYAVYACYLLFRHYRTAETTRRKQQILYILVGMIIGYVGGSSNFLLFFKFPVPPYLNGLGFVYVAMFAFAILRHQLLDIEVIVKKTLVFAGLAGFVTGSLTLGVVLLRDLLGAWLGLGWFWPTLLSAVLIVSLYRPLETLLLNLTDRFLFQKKYDYKEVIQKLSEELVTELRLEKLVQRIATVLKDSLKIENCSVVLISQATHSYQVHASEGIASPSPSSFDVEHPFILMLRKNPQILTKEQFKGKGGPDSGTQEVFRSLGMELCVPLMLRKDLVGFISLGKKKSDEDYTQEDKVLLSALIRQGAIAINNAILFAEAEQKQALEFAYSKLRELDELKTQFFSNVSHEFRTPLTLILAPAESILRGEAGSLPPKAKEEAKVIYDNSLRLLKLIDDTLDIAKIDAQKMELHLERNNLDDLIKGIVASAEHLAQKKGLKLSYISKDTIPEFCFDRDKIEKVLLNLLTNALKFTDKGQIEITSQKNGEKALITIKDTGIGIAEKDLPRLFSRFVQLDGSATKRYEGTGIGLALSRDLVRLHQGEIKIESRPSEGTTVTVELPLNLEKDLTSAKAPLKDLPKTPREKDDWIKEIHKKAQYTPQSILEDKIEASKPRPFRKTREMYTILVVEDNPDMLHFISTQLKNDYQVVGARDGEEGLESARKFLPDLILSDIMMPKMSGYDLLKAVREDYSLRNIPVIFLTAKAEQDMKIEGLEYGVNDYLTKPFNSQELLARVKNLIKIRELQQELYSVAKLASIGQLAAGTAHEINNPLAASMSELRVLKRELTGQNNNFNREKSNELISKSYASLERIERIVRDLLSFSRKNREGIQLGDVHEGLDSTLSLLNHELKGRIEVHKEYCVDGKIECDLGKLNQVFMNVLLNSVQAIKHKGNIWITTSRKNSDFIVAIKDDGVGIKKGDLDKVFDPFFTTKDVNQGVGLGLTVSHNLIKEHGGEIAIESESGKGTEVTITVKVRS